jgi:hypothetical protein
MPFSIFNYFFYAREIVVPDPVAKKEAYRIVREITTRTLGIGKLSELC